jgi:hypothetical protein
MSSLGLRCVAKRGSAVAYTSWHDCMQSKCVKEVPLLLSMIFAQHKRLMELEERIKEVCRVDSEH